VKWEWSSQDIEEEEIGGVSEFRSWPEMRLKKLELPNTEDMSMVVLMVVTCGQDYQ